MRLADLASEGGVWKVAEHFERPDGTTLALDYLGETKSAKKGLRLIVFFLQQEDSSTVRLLLKDRSFNTPDWTYESYLVATTFLKSLLRIYNRKYGTRKRLIVPSPESLEPWLSLREAIAFDRFRQEARERPHSFETQERLDHLIYIFARGRPQCDDFRRLLELNGLTRGNEPDYADIYRNGLRLLKRRRSVGFNSPHPVQKWVDRYNNQQWVE